MKNVFTVLVLCISCMIYGQPSVSNPIGFESSKGVLSFQNETVDYGTIKQNSDGNREFIFTNTGKSPIVITKIKASCGCTVPTKPEHPIKK